MLPVLRIYCDSAKVLFVVHPARATALLSPGSAAPCQPGRIAVRLFAHDASRMCIRQLKSSSIGRSEVSVAWHGVAQLMHLARSDDDPPCVQLCMDCAFFDNTPHCQPAMMRTWYLYRSMHQQRISDGMALTLPTLC